MGHPVTASQRMIGRGGAAAIWILINAAFCAGGDGKVALLTDSGAFLARPSRSFVMTRPRRPPLFPSSLGPDNCILSFLVHCKYIQPPLARRAGGSREECESPK